ncbi:MAG: hypothetical protein JXA43_03545 [Candidatus Diapherotrites archaeon]|nr:hypothetical protein [Candidatus Diapherotrites archaeon]
MSKNKMKFKFDKNMMILVAVVAIVIVSAAALMMLQAPVVASDNLGNDNIVIPSDEGTSDDSTYVDSGSALVIPGKIELIDVVERSILVSGNGYSDEKINSVTLNGFAYGCDNVSVPKDGTAILTKYNCPGIDYTGIVLEGALPAMVVSGTNGFFAEAGTSTPVNYAGDFANDIIPKSAIRGAILDVNHRTNQVKVKSLLNEYVEIQSVEVAGVGTFTCTRPYLQPRNQIELTVVTCPGLNVSGGATSGYKVLTVKGTNNFLAMSAYELEQ